MARPEGTLKLTSNIEPQVGAPLDARTIVPTVADLTLAASFPYSYVGMIVSVQATGDVYILKAKPTTVETNWGKVAAGGDMDAYYTKAEIDSGWYNKEQVNQLIVKLYKPAGNATLATLPVLDASVIGNVYNMTEEFDTTADFVEGAGKHYGVGSNVAVVDLGGYSAVTPVGSEDPSDEGWYEIKNGVYVLSQDTEVDGEKTYYSYTANPKFDVLPGFIDLSMFLVQVTELTDPTDLTAADVGKIVQYIGETDATENLFNGFFYIVQEVTPVTDPPTYEWVQKPVQDISGAGQLNDVLDVTEDAGGINTGATYAAGTSFETLWRDLLNPLTNPTLTAPSATLTTLADKLLEVGDSITATLTAVFNRGSIVPSYGTDGYRSGAATGYTLSNGDTDASGSFANVTIDGTHNSFTVDVAYAAGEQPKNSRGGDYDAPLPTGTVTSPALTFEFVNAIWANTASIATVAKLALVSASAKVKEMTFPAATVDNPEVFDIPASWNVTGVEVYNTFSGKWESNIGEWDTSSVNHDDAGGTTTSYTRYTCNLGYAMGSRQIRVKWS